MNAPTVGRTLTIHRKTAVSFRDQSLFPIFQIAITTLRQISMQVPTDGVTQKDRDKMGNLALQLSTACLSFDFIGKV